MGQAIVYCSNCSAQVRGADFEARKAFKVEDQIFCAKCCREILGYEPAKTSSSSSVHLKAQPRSSSSTSRIAIQPPPPPPAPPPARSPLPMILGVVGVAAVLVLVAISMSGSPPPPRETPAPAPQAAAAPAAAPAPRPSAREGLAQEALGRALRTENLAARRTLLVEAVALAEGTTLLADAKSELDRVERKLADLKAGKPAPAPEVKPEPVAPPPPVVAKPKPPPPPPDTFTPWKTAMAPATAREYAAAAGDAADAALLKAVAGLHQEAVQALGRIPKGTRIALDYRDAAGQVRHVEAPLVDEENGRLQVGGAEIEVGEILPSSLAELVKTRDAAAATAYCLLEGDEAGAKRMAGTVPDKYWTYARTLAADPARGLYHEAMTLAGAFATEAEAIPKFQALLRDFAQSPFVRRNKTSLTARLQTCARDFLFVAADLKPAGTFKGSRTPKGAGCWTSENDSEPNRIQENFLELAYSAVADTPYKCWIYAAGCCRETFEFSIQGSEMKTPVTEVKPWLSSLKKTHSGHTGPKQPAHWEWVSIPLPKYATTGPQSLRILTDQKGFTVAFACISATRTNPPKELDLRELERARGERPALTAPPPKATVLFALKLDGTDKALCGEVRDKALYGTNLFGACFAGVEGHTGLIMPVPAKGELRMTYFLKTVTPMYVRFRAARGEGKSDMFDAPLPPPVAGQPQEVRIPLSDFKPPYGGTPPPLAAGDSIPMIYVVGTDPACGLRIDALSVVELKIEKTAVESSAKLLFSENFDNGIGKFQESTVAEGGIKGTKALSIPSTGISAWGAWSIPVKDSVTVSFKLKPNMDIPQIVVMVWSDALKDNCRYHIDNLKKGEWKEIRFKAGELKVGGLKDGAPLDLFANIKIFLLATPPEARVLMDDFEIRQ